MSDDKLSGIKGWAEEDRPREKLITHGKKALTNAELLAIVLGSGSTESSAVELARKVLNAHDHNLDTVSRLSVKELSSFKGIGPAKAISVIATLELGRRLMDASPMEKPQITCSSDTYSLLRSRMEDLDHEVFNVLYLNRNNRVIQIKKISEGGIVGTVVDPRLIFKMALEINAVSIVLAHNHPSGNLKPSSADKTITQKLVDSGKFLEINVLDHLIISDQGYYSFADEGLL